jgi:hypothetical protein
MVNRILPTFFRSLLDLWDNLLVLVIANLIWTLCLTPVVLLLYLPLDFPLILLPPALALVLIGGPTTIGLFSLTSGVTRLERLDLGQFFSGIRQYYRRGMLLMAFNLLFVAVLYSNFLFYSQAGLPTTIAWIIAFWVGLFWFILQIFLWPLAVKLEDRLKIGLLFRNGLLATFKYLAFSMAIGLVLAIGAFGSYMVLFLPTAIGGMVLHALVSNQALGAILEHEKTSGDSAPNEDQS